MSTDVQDFVPEAVEAEPLTPDPPRTEAERLDPAPVGPITLSTGTQIEIVPMKLRETMKLLRIVTHGAGTYIGTLLDGLSLDDPAAFAQSLATVVFMSLPDAEDETVAFIQAMCVPANMPESAKARAEMVSALREELNNPELDDSISIVERIIKRESEDIRALGKRLAAALNLAAAAGELPKPEATPQD